MIKVYTDGATAPNPGNGAWGCVIIYPSGQKAQHHGYISDKTTNNFCELTAVHEGLKRVDPKSTARVYTDSQYIVNSINKGWAKGWAKRGWKTCNGNPIAHQDLWVKILSMIDERDISFEWVKGHAGDEHNEMADKLATLAISNERKRRQDE